MHRKRALFFIITNHGSKWVIIGLINYQPNVQYVIYIPLSNFTENVMSNIEYYFDSHLIVII